MHIFFLNSRKAFSYGGGEKWIINTAACLHLMGHHVVIGGAKHSLLVKYAKERDLRTYEIDIPRDISPFMTWRLKKYMDRERFDVVVCNTNRDVRVGGLAAKISGVQRVYARHGLRIIRNKWRYTLPLKWLTQGIITNTKSIGDEYEGYTVFPPGFVQVVYNGMEIPGDIVACDFSRNHPGKKIILSAGRLTEQKGFEDLLDAASLLCKKRDDLIFLIAGKGVLEEKLQTKIKTLHLEKHVFLIGFHPLIYPFIKGADLFVLSSHSEGMPNVVMESMMLGTPVVATDVNGVKELIRHNHSGILVEISNPEKMAAGIELILDSEEAANRFRENAYQTITHEFTNEHMAARLLHIFSH